MRRFTKQTLGGLGGGMTGAVIGVEAATGVVEAMLPTGSNLAKLAVFLGFALVGAVGGAFAGIGVASS